MPMQFSQRAWLERHDRRGDGFCDWEVARVYCLDASSATGGFFGFDLAGFEDVGAIAFELAEWRFDRFGGKVGFEDVGVCGGDGV